MLTLTTIALIWAAFFYVLFLRIAYGQEGGAVYTLDHPINPDWLILATPEGRYSVTRLDACGWLTGDMNVREDAVDGQLVQVSHGSNACTLGVLGLVDPTPCFADADGACDINAGEHYW